MGRLESRQTRAGQMEISPYSNIDRFPAAWLQSGKAALPGALKWVDASWQVAIGIRWLKDKKQTAARQCSVWNSKRMVNRRGFKVVDCL